MVITGVYHTLCHCVDKNWQPKCVQHGWISTSPHVSFKFWLNWTFIANKSNTLAGTSFKQCEPEVNNSHMEGAVCLTCLWPGFISVLNQLMYVPLHSVLKLSSDTTLLQRFNCISSLVCKLCLASGHFYRLSSLYLYSLAESCDWQKNRRQRVWHMARWAAFNVPNNGLLISPSHWSTIISMRF